MPFKIIKGWEAQGGMKYYNIIFMRAPTSPYPQGGVHLLFMIGVFGDLWGNYLTGARLLGLAIDLRRAVALAGNEAFVTTQAGKPVCIQVLEFKQRHSASKSFQITIYINLVG